MNIEQRSQDFWRRVEAEAEIALKSFPDLEDDVHLTQRTMRAARLVPEAAQRLGLTAAREMLAGKFKISERTIRRAEFIRTRSDIAVIVMDGLVVIDTAEKIMKNAVHAGAEVLMIAWLSASPKDQNTFLEKIGLLKKDAAE